MYDQNALIFPSSPSTIIDGQKCGSCRSILPSQKIHHLIDFEKDSLLATKVEQRKLNNVTCIVCGNGGTYSFSALIILRSRNIKIHLLPRHSIIPLEKKIESVLDDLAVKFIGVNTSQYYSVALNDYNQIPTLIEFPDEFWANFNSSREQRYNRLIMPPRRAAKSIIEVFKNEYLNSEAREELRFNISLTRFEISPSGQQLLQAGIENHIENELDLKFVSTLQRNTEKLRKYAEETFLDGNYTYDIDDAAIQLMNSIDDEITSKVDLRKLLFKIEEFYQSGNYYKALDGLEFYMKSIRPGHYSLQDFQTFTLYALLCELTGEWQDTEPEGYFGIVIHYLEENYDHISSEAKLLLAQAYEGYRLLCSRNGFWIPYCECLIKSVKLLLEIDLDNEAHEAINALMEKSIEIGEQNFYEESILLFKRLHNRPEIQQKDSIRLNNVLSKFPATLKDFKPSGYNSQNDNSLIVNLLDDGEIWDNLLDGVKIEYGEALLLRDASNYNKHYIPSVYRNRKDRNELFLPHDIPLLRSLMTKNMLTPDNGPYITLRLYEAEKDQIEQVLVDEQVILASWLGDDEIEVFEVHGDNEARMLEFHELYGMLNWACRNGRHKWTLNKLTDNVLIEHLTSLEFPADNKVELAFSLSSMLKDQKVTTEEKEHLAQLVLKLSDLPTLAITSFSAYSEYNYHQSRGLAHEFKNDLPASIFHYMKNISTARMRYDNTDEAIFLASNAPLMGSQLNDYVRAYLKTKSQSSDSAQSYSRLFFMGEEFRNSLITKNHSTPSKRKLQEPTLTLNDIYGQLETEVNYMQLWEVSKWPQDGSQLVIFSYETPNAVSALALRTQSMSKIHKQLSDFFFTGAAFSENFESIAPKIEEAFRDAAYGVLELFKQASQSAGEIKPQTLLLNAQGFSLNVPWAFLCILSSKMTNSRSRICILCFSLLSYAMSAKKEQIPRQAISIHLFCQNNLEFFDSQKAIENWKLFSTPTTNSKSHFLDSLVKENVTVFIGHGKTEIDIEDSSLYFLDGSTLDIRDFANLPPRHSNYPSVAIIFGCWAGTMAERGSISSWTSKSIPAALKAMGVDYIISSIWPIDEKIAYQFCSNFLSEYSNQPLVCEAFARAYEKLFDDFEHSELIIGGSTIQLYA